jgi:hypothetical protein
VRAVVKAIHLIARAVEELSGENPRNPEAPKYQRPLGTQTHRPHIWPVIGYRDLDSLGAPLPYLLEGIDKRHREMRAASLRPLRSN